MSVFFSQLQYLKGFNPKENKHNKIKIIYIYGDKTDPFSMPDPSFIA